MRVALFFLALLTLGAAKPPAKPIDWSRKVTLSPAGAYVIGNPAAKVRVVEFMSYTCPHCAHFAAEGNAKLIATYVAKGSVAFEIRNAVRDGLDFTMALATRCGGPTRFFGNHEAVFADQDLIITKAATFDDVGSVATNNPDPDSRVKSLANGSGLVVIMGKRGIAQPALEACLTDKAAQKAIVAMTRDAWETRKIPGTPAFLINGRLAPSTTDWSGLEPQIRAALASRAKAG